MKTATFSQFHRSALIALTVAFANSAVAATLIQSFSPAANDRFANSPSFIGSGYDFSGIGRDSFGRWAVMLSPTVFLSANHYAPTGSLIFRAGNDPASSPVTASILQGQRIGNTDLYIGRIASPLPSSIASYQFATVPLNTALLDVSVFMGGISPTTTGYGSGSPSVTNHTVGTNRIEGYQSNLAAAGAVGDVLLTVANMSGDAGFSHTTYEAQLAAGDSGSPLLGVSGGNLIVAGIALGVGQVQIAGGAFRDATAFTYTGSYASQIGNYIAASPVPEPSGWMLASVAWTTWIWRRRRPSRVSATGQANN